MSQPNKGPPAAHTPLKVVTGWGAREQRPRFKRSVFVALLHGDLVFTVTELDGLVGFPGGKVKEAESWMTALVREFREETGGKLPFKRYTHISTGTATYEARFFAAQVDDHDAAALTYQATVAQSPDVASWAWVSRHELQGLRLRPHIRAAVMLFDALAASPLRHESAWGRLLPRRVLSRPGREPAAAASSSSSSSSSAAAAAADIGHSTNEDDASSRQSDEASTTSESEEESEEESSEGDDEGENDAEEHGGRAMRALNRYLAAEESARSPTTHHPRETP